jgi:hypothetical protein
MVGSDYSIYHIMTVTNPSWDNWKGFKVFRLDPLSTDPLVKFKWQKFKNEA